MSSAAAYDEVPFSELLREPAITTERLQKIRSLRLRRRDAEDLILFKASRVESEEQVTEVTARLLAGLLQTEDGPNILRRVALKAIPWTRFLPQKDLDEFLNELVEISLAAVAIDNLAPLGQLLIEWQHTAEVHADPELKSRLTRVYTDQDDYGPVSRTAISRCSCGSRLGRAV